MVFEQISRRLCSVLRRAPDFSPGRAGEKRLRLFFLPELKLGARRFQESAPVLVLARKFPPIPPNLHTPTPFGAAAPSRTRPCRPPPAKAGSSPGTTPSASAQKLSSHLLYPRTENTPPNTWGAQGYSPPRGQILPGHRNRLASSRLRFPAILQSGTEPAGAGKASRWLRRPR